MMYLVATFVVVGIVVFYYCLRRQTQLDLDFMKGELLRSELAKANMKEQRDRYKASSLDLQNQRDFYKASAYEFYAQYVTRDEQVKYDYLNKMCIVRNPQ